MPLQKTPISINFAKGLDTKTDPFQLQLNSFAMLQNSIFDTAGRLTKRNGFPQITQLPNTDQTTLTTLNDNLLATGSNLYAFSQDTSQWLNKGSVQPVSLSTQPLVRVSTSQTSPDSAISETGLTCLVYLDNSVAYYQVSDSNTGQQIVARTSLAQGGASATTNPRVFLVGKYFIITYMATISASPHFQFVAIPTATPASPLANTEVSLTAPPTSINAGYDGFVANDNLYLSWAGTGTMIKTTYINGVTLTSAAPKSIASHTSTLMSVTADTSTSIPVIWLTFYNSGDTSLFTAAYDANLSVVFAATAVVTTAINQVTSVATGNVLSIFYEQNNTYGYTPNAKSDFISTKTVTVAGTVSSATTILRSVGLASKAFIDASGTIYMMATYGETNQPTYFLINASGAIFMRLAYANGGGYGTTQVLPTVGQLDNIYYYPYLIKDFLAAVNKGTNLPSGTPVNGIYTQTGVNLAKFSINENSQHSSEIAGSLFLTGGQLWQYDGVSPVEQGFHVYPENITVTTATGSGAITAQLYYYVFCYEWTDAQGNLQRSAPSIPVGVTTTTSSSTNTINVPTLRLTDKVAPNPVRIVGYRWSTAQQVYYQFTSITSPNVNSTSADNVTMTDSLADSSILGNTLLYTTGGVIENIAPPASIASTLFKNRVFIIDAEDRNLIWYSKQVIENTPVEMSDLLTLYVAPTSGAQGSTGPLAALSAMDDKLIMFKKDASYYMTGTGPDNTGANNDFSDPIFITSSVGCANPNSIVLMPHGIMFQSDKGIWLLGRDLSTTYIGAPVEIYNQATVMSATVIPGTNQVRFILDTGITLMYDYFYNQWGTFTNLTAISATLYQGKHTYLNSFGIVYQESPGTYLDGTRPVLMSLTTAWINLAGLQGFERFYAMYILGVYKTPFNLNVSLAYNYNPSPTQTTIVKPDNYSPPWGGDANWGSGVAWGGVDNVFSNMVFPSTQKCESFQITLQETYDSTFGVPAGEGLTLSGLNLVIGVKKGYRTQKASRSFG